MGSPIFWNDSACVAATALFGKEGRPTTVGRIGFGDVFGLALGQLAQFSAQGGHFVGVVLAHLQFVGAPDLIHRGGWCHILHGIPVLCLRRLRLRARRFFRLFTSTADLCLISWSPTACGS